MRLGRSGLETRVARRVLFLFLLCAAVPVATFGALGYLQIRGQLHEQAWHRLATTAKSISMSLMERLLLLESDLHSTDSAVARDIVEAVDGPIGGDRWVARGTWVRSDVDSDRRFDDLMERGGSLVLGIEPSGIVRIVRASEDRTAVHWGDVNASYLESVAQALPAEASLCVTVAGQRIVGCDGWTSPRSATPSDGASSQVEWRDEDGRRMGVRRELFLAGEFSGSQSWDIFVGEPRDAVMAPIRSFTRTLFLVLLLGTLLVAFSSEIQLKRTLGPLAHLKRVTERVAAGDLDTRVTVHTGDEFEDLADSFNDMVGRLASLLGELDALNVGTLRALAAAIDAKSHWTAGHSDRVTAVSLALGRALGLSEDELVILERGAILHDVGKIAVPAVILDKAGPLTEAEFDVMRSHPTHGVRIVTPIAQYGPLIPIIGQHHERWDGRGYPDGLVGEEIEFGARIVAVADGFDAMTSDRPYRDGLPIERALEVIAAERGGAYEPRVAVAFIALCARAVASEATHAWLWPTANSGGGAPPEDDYDERRTA